MTNESRISGRPEDNDKLFEAAVDAAFSDASPGGLQVPAGSTERKVHEVVQALREAATAEPSRALRSRAVALYGERSPLLAGWVAAVKRIAMSLVSPPQPALAGFRATATPLETFHAKCGDVEAWLDLQVDRDGASVSGRRLRGQVTIESATGVLRAVGVHAVDMMSARGGGEKDVLATCEVDDEGRFALDLDAAVVDLVIELSDGDEALAIPGIVLRT